MSQVVRDVASELINKARVRNANYRFITCALQPRANRPARGGCIRGLAWHGPFAGRSSDDEAVAIATNAYIYGYPLVTMEITRRVATNIDVPNETGHAPMGQFSHMRKYPDASFRDVTAPNADTLYSTAWLDLSKEPYVLSLPDTKGRYYLMPMLDGWTNVFTDPGKRTTGAGAQTYAIVGPSWNGDLPKDVKEVRSPTNMAWVLGRTYSTGTAKDYEEVHALQDKYSLVPLSAYGKPYAPPKGHVDPSIDMKTPVRDQVNRLDAQAFFQILASAMKNNPPAAADQPTRQDEDDRDRRGAGLQPE